MTFPESLIRHSTSTSLTDDIEGFMKLSDQGGEWVLMATRETPREVTCSSVSGNGLEARRYNS